VHGLIGGAARVIGRGVRSAFGGGGRLGGAGGGSTRISRALSRRTTAARRQELREALNRKREAQREAMGGRIRPASASRLMRTPGAHASRRGNLAGEGTIKPSSRVRTGAQRQSIAGGRPSRFARGRAARYGGRGAIGLGAGYAGYRGLEGWLDPDDDTSDTGGNISPPPMVVGPRGPGAGGGVGGRPFVDGPRPDPSNEQKDPSFAGLPQAGLLGLPRRGARRSARGRQVDPMGRLMSSKFGWPENRGMTAPFKGDFRLLDWMNNVPYLKNDYSETRFSGPGMTGMTSAMARMMGIPRYKTGANKTQEGLAYLHANEAVLPPSVARELGPKPVETARDLPKKVASTEENVDKLSTLISNLANSVNKLSISFGGTTQSKFGTKPPC